VDLIAAGVCFLMRGKDYKLLDLSQVKVRLALLPDEQFTHPRSVAPAGISLIVGNCLSPQKGITVESLWPPIPPELPPVVSG
jgi:hypothetical protein